MSKTSPKPFDITPKRRLGTKGILIPMHSIKEANMSESAEKKTPHPVNPFDVKAESLYFHSCSPFFATLSRNKKDDGTFRWSIDQLSVLCPADIDETSLPDNCIDPEQESKAQEAIDAFFSQNSIVPSPWSDNSPYTEGRNNFKSRRTSHIFTEVSKPNCDISTQTTLSIPPNVDLEKILGKYFTFNDEESLNQDNSREEIDPLSTSSLRRKLFVTEEECISPPRVENKNLFRARLWSTPTAKSCSIHSTPASDMLSSSPITPPICSESCNILSPPPVSPIGFDTNRNSSVQMKSYEDESNSNIYYSSENIAISTGDMSFLTESQDANPFPSENISEKQDTGYVTGSISSSQNMNFSEVNYGIVSKIIPVVELMEECELSNSVSCEVSYKNEICVSTSDSDGLINGSISNSNLKNYPWVPTCSSTPAHMFTDL